MHQYQRSEQSPLIFNELAEQKKKMTAYNVGTQGPGLKQANKMWLGKTGQCDAPPSLLDNWIANGLLLWLTKSVLISLQSMLFLELKFDS